MTLTVEEDIFWLEIPINYTILMQALECDQNLSWVENCPFLLKSLFLPKMVKQFSSVQKIHDKVQLLRILKGVVQLNNKRVIDFLQHDSFWFGVLFLFSFYHMIFLEGFHRKMLLSVFFTDQVHFPKRAPTYDLENIERLQINVSRSMVQIKIRVVIFTIFWIW